MQLLKCKAILFSPWLINNCHNKKGFFWTQIDRTKHNRLGMRHLRLIYLSLDADSCYRNVYNTVRAAINLIRQSMSLSIFFVSLNTHTQKPPPFLSKESHITCMQVWDLQMVCKKGILLWPGRAGSRKGQTVRQHGSVMSKMRARMPSRFFSVFLLVLFGDIRSTSRNHH